MIAIIDYGMGNLRSVQKALEKSGGETIISSDRQDILNADKVVLPGVGAMQPAMERLRSLDLVTAIQETVSRARPFLGICLGFQLLFDTSDEGGQVKGLGVIPGTVVKFRDLKVPHMGWNRIRFTKKDCPLWAGLNDLAHVYFCHSYYGQPGDPSVVASRTDYGTAFASAVWQKNIFGVQFHPEKSQTAGLRILKNFVDLTS